MDEFIRSHVKSLQSTSARPPKPVSCLRVERTAPRSVAGHASIAAGDLLVSLDGGPASKADPKLYKHRANKRLYTFFSHARAEQVELACTGIEIGVELAYTSEAIKVRYKPAAFDPTALEALWKNRSHQLLMELSSATLAHPGMRETPALLFEGVGLWEAGRHDEGMPRIQDYQRHHARSWTTNYAAIGMHYQGLEHLRLGRPDEALERLRAAFAYCPFVRTSDEIERLTGERPPPRSPKWTGQQWPARYSLPTLEGEPGWASLADSLASMGDGKVFIVCLLATYRSNGPYGEFLERWLNFATWFGPFLGGLHVITMEPARFAEGAWHYRLEDSARSLACRFNLLFDERGDVHTPVAPDRSPFICALDRRGTVLYEGDLESVDLWDTLAALEGRR